MEAIQNNAILIYSFLSVVEWAVLGTVAALFIARRYASKSRELKALKQQQATIESRPPEIDLKQQLLHWMKQTEQRMGDGEDGQNEYLQARLAFLQSEIISLENQQSPHYWDDMCVRLASILPEPQLAPTTSVDDEAVSEAEAAQLLEVPDYLDDINGGQTQNDSQSPSSDNAQTPFSRNYEINFAEEDFSLPEEKNADLRKIRSNLQKQFAALQALKIAIDGQSIPNQGDLRTLLEHIEVAQAHMRLSSETLSEELSSLEQLRDSLSGDEALKDHNPLSWGELDELEGLEDSSNSDELDELHELEGLDDSENWQHTVDDLQQQIEDRELVIEHLQTELESVRTQLLKLEAQLETQLQNEVENASTAQAANVRVFEETDEPEQLNYQIESLTDLLVQKSEQLAQLQSDIPLPEDAFDNDETMQQVLAQQESNQEFLPQLDDVVHPSYVSASYELTEQQEAMIEDIDLAEDEDLEDVDLEAHDDKKDPPLSHTG